MFYLISIFSRRTLFLESKHKKLVIFKGAGASFIKWCAETILNLILRSYLEYVYVWFIEWTYEQKTRVRISFRCEIYESQMILNLHAIEWFQLSACKWLLINVINIKYHQSS